MSIASPSNLTDHAGPPEDGAVRSVRPRSRAWATAGVLAGIGSLASVFLSMMLSPEYVAGSVVTPEQIADGLVAKQPIMVAFHVVTLASALLIVVFAAGLHRRLVAALPHNALAPTVALAGMLLVAAAQVLGTGLDTEFLFGVEDTAINLPSDIGFYSHWIATIPWLWFGGGLAALSLGVATFEREARDSIPKWIGVLGFILGGVTLLLALSPLQYMSAMPGAFWLCLTALGFAIGDRSKRSA